MVVAASKVDELKKVAAECEALGAKTEIVALRPSSEENCEKIVKSAVDKFGRLDILVVASGLNKVSKIVDQKPEDFLDVMDANVTQSWLMARAAGKQMLKQGGGGKGVDYVVECSAATSAVNDAVRMVNRGGRVCLAAFAHEEVPVDVAHIVRNNIYLYGIRGEGKSATHRAEGLCV